MKGEPGSVFLTLEKLGPKNTLELYDTYILVLEKVTGINVLTGYVTRASE